MDPPGKIGEQKMYYCTDQYMVNFQVVTILSFLSYILFYMTCFLILRISANEYSLSRRRHLYMFFLGENYFLIENI